MNNSNKLILAPKENRSLLLTKSLKTQIVIPQEATFSLIYVGGEDLCLDCLLTGEKARFEVQCVYLADAITHPDIQISVTHSANNTSSYQTIRGVLANQAKASFTGTITVPKGLSGIEGHQKHQAIMLSDNAVVKATPQLFVNSEDASCSHGNTVGFLDQEALFYLQSRGLDLPTAKQLLIKGFLCQDLPKEAVSLITKWTEKNV